MINMNPDVYEQYIYQKGIRDQLRKTVTTSSFLSTVDKKININANYNKRIGKISILDSNVINTDNQISLDEINDYYENNKDDFYLTFGRVQIYKINKSIYHFFNSSS